FEVGVDGSGGLLGARVGGNGPGAALVFAGGEEADEPEQFVTLADEADEAAFRESVGGEKFFVFHFGQFGFDFAAEGGDSGVGAGGEFGKVVFGGGGFEVGAEGGAFR